ncbi:MAG: phosphopantetheine-binding protein, partial [Sulfurovum sp.]|nr:phosphopantetheine-binding protein [Sulfurovum sp.]
KLAKIFQEVLNVERVGIYDNFFELGGHSLLATQLVSRIRSELEIELPLHYVFIESTITNFYNYIIERKKYKSILVPLEKGGTSTPIFSIHGLGGNAQQFKKLSNLLGKKQPMYAFQDVILEEESMNDISVKKIVKKNISLIKDIYPKGPYILIGHSVGGWIAYEMALMLEQEGYAINSLILLDSYVPELINFSFENIDLIDKFNSLNISYEKYLKLRDIYADYQVPIMQLNCNIYLFVASQNNLKKENISLWKNIDSKIIIKEFEGDHFSILTSESLVSLLNYI